MRPAEPRRLSLEVRFDRRPIEGRLLEEEGRLVRPFSGWIGLMAAIQAAGFGSSEGEDDVVQFEQLWEPKHSPLVERD